MTSKKLELSQIYTKKEELYDHNISDEAHPDLRTAASRSTIVDMIYPVGAIYMSVNSVNPATLFGGTWSKIEGRFLLASGKAPEDNTKTYNVNNTGGSKNAVVVSHNHNQNAHTHTQNSHNHTQNSHNHSSPNSSNNYKFLVADDNIAVNGTPRGAVGGDGDWHYVYAPTKNGLADILEYQNTANATATNNAATAVNQNTVATNQASGVSGTDQNMPPYVVVNVWQRTG